MRLPAPHTVCERISPPHMRLSADIGIEACESAEQLRADLLLIKNSPLGNRSVMCGTCQPTAPLGYHEKTANQHRTKGPPIGRSSAMQTDPEVSQKGRGKKVLKPRNPEIQSLGARRNR
jgi:hypothetical protein